MLGLVVTALGLGIAGVDPAGALIAISALAAGARDRHVVAFAAVSVLGTAALGVVLPLTVGQELGAVEWRGVLPPDRLAALVELLVAFGLLAWGVVRLRRTGARPPKPSTGRTGGTALVGLGAAFAASAVLDPTFVGLVVLAGRAGSVPGAVAAHLLWIIVSQVMLVVLAAAILLRRHDPVVAWFQRLLARIRPALAIAATGALLVAGAVLAADALWWFATERFLLPHPT